MQKRMISLCLILCVFFSVFALASCGGADATTGTTSDATVPVTEETIAEPAVSEVTTAEETAVATTDKWEALAPKVRTIVERDRTLRIECSIFKNATKASKNDIYLKGPDQIMDGVTPLIEQMVYERNRAADELLGTTTEFVFWDLDFGKQAEPIDLAVKGKAADAPDLFVNMLNLQDNTRRESRQEPTP